MEQSMYHTYLLQTTPGLSMDLARMDDINYLRYRTAALETELRLVKEQLAQAQSGTHYLLNCLAGSGPRQQHIPTRFSGTQFDLPLNDFSHSRPQLEISDINRNCAHDARKLKHDDSVSRSFYGTLNHSPDLRNRTEGHLPPSSREDDLLIFDGHEDSPTITETQTPQSAFGSKIEPNTHFSQASLNTVSQSPAPRRTIESPDAIRTKPKKVGLGIQNLHDDGIERHDSPIDFQRESRYIHGKNCDASNGPPAFGKASKSKGMWTSIHAPPPDEPELIFDRAFLDAEHNRLLNSTCFIEDMTGEDREEHWIKLGQEKDRHSAREWKLYYERVILPAYRAKVQTTEAPTPSTPKDRDEEKPVCESKSNPEPEDASPTAAGGFLRAPRPEAEDRTSPISDIQEIAGSTEVAEKTSKLTAEIVTGQNDVSGTTTSMEQESTSPCLVGNSGIDEAHTTTDIVNNTIASNASPVTMDSSPSNNGTPIPTFNGTDSRFLSPPTQFRPSIRQRFGPPSQFHAYPTEALHIRHTPNSEHPAQFRTVLISNIPADTMVAEVLSGVRGGKIVKATFLETKGMKTKPPITTNTAIVEFLNASDAAMAAENGIKILDATSNEHNSQQALEIHLLKSPTRPLHPKLESDMRQYGLTRVLVVTGQDSLCTTEAIMDRICGRHRHQKKPLVAGELQDGRLFFEFADVRDAVQAWEVMQVDNQGLRGLHKGFLPDPCDVEVATKEEVAECTSGSDADDEDDGGSAAIDTPAASFEEAS